MRDDLDYIKKTEPVLISPIMTRHIDLQDVQDKNTEEYEEYEDYDPVDA